MAHTFTLHAHDVVTTGTRASDRHVPGVRRLGLKARLARLACALHGHDHVLAFEGERMFLSCPTCGHESPGWEPADRRPIVRWAQPQATPLVASFARRARTT